MATTEQLREPPSRERVAGYVLIGLVAMVAVGVLIAYLGRAPQMGADEDVFRTVDALYTAVRMKDEKRIGECETRLHGYRDAGKLPTSAAEFLDDVIAKALDRPEVVLALDLGLGEGAATAWGCDLTEEYVRINASYTT